MKGTLTINNLKTKEFNQVEFSEERVIKEFTKSLSLALNRKNHHRIKTVKVIDKYYKEYGLNIKIHFLDDIIDMIYDYHFEGEDLEEYYNN